MSDEPGHAKIGRVIRRAEWGVAIGLTVILVGLHLAFLLGAGALWRDEVDCVNFANLPSLEAQWTSLQFQSFPILWSTVLSAWVRIGPGTTDFGIRILGFLVGLGILAVLWRNARSLGHSPPLLSLTLLGLNAAVISYGDSIRGYGLGMLTGLLAFGLIWEAADAPAPRRLGLATLAAVVAVHCLYYNVIIVLAACLAGAAVTLRRKAWRSAGLIVGIGAVCAISLLPYVHTFRNVREWNDLLRAAVDLTRIWRKLEGAFASTGGAIFWVWIGLTALALVASLRARVLGPRSDVSERQLDAALYCGVALLIGIPAYVVFLEKLRYVTEPWYYVALMALVAACLDTPVSLLARTLAARSARLTVIVAVAALVIHPVWTAVRTRRTNVDLVASRVEELAVPGDLIVVNPWFVGITFDRYHHGKADWITIPPLSSHTGHRYDLLKEQMMSARAMAPVLERMKAALEEGRRVFWVGDLPVPQKGEVPVDPPPAPRASWGWYAAPYDQAWRLQASYLIKSHARAAQRIAVPLQQRVSSYEDCALFVFSGWWAGRAPN